MPSSHIRFLAGLVASLLFVSVSAEAAPAILNEYNAVREDKFPKNGGIDPALGNPAGTPVLGNGSINAPFADRNDWFEIVVIADHLDMRGWSLLLFDDGAAQAPLVFTNDALWSDLRAGSIITVFESDDLPEDTAYDPGTGDYAIAIRTHDSASGTYLTAQDIHIGNTDFQLTILDHKSRVMFGPAGEGVSPLSGIASDEIFELEADPSELITPLAIEYDDGNSSTYAEPNRYTQNTQTQDFSNLRNGTPILDSDQDGIPDCTDNCRFVFNPWQSNSGGDGFGNSCDPDFDNSNLVDASDETALNGHLGEAVTALNDEFDLNDDDVIDAVDLAVLQGFLGSAPGPGAQANPICDVVDPTEALFDPDRLLDVQITMAAADWDALRTQTRDLQEALPCAETERMSPFTFFPAEVTVDGTLVSNTGVRKKGFQGSLSTSRPSLKVDFTEFVSGQQLEGMNRLTLNNNRQDASFINTCMAYYVMRQAGIPAPRCNHARVTVNGQDLGIYSNVESIKNPYLIRNFGSAAGNLYEGTLSDIRAGYFGTFEIKNGGDSQDILALAHLLEGTDAEIIAELANHMDVDEFIKFWALEGIVGHWDGYNSNNNNFWIYNDPVTSLRFIPWGADSVFGDQGGFVATGGPANSVNLNSQLAKRLYDIPVFQAQFLAELFAQRDVFFPSGGSAAVIAEIDRAEALINPVGGPGSDPDITTAIAERRQWAMDRFDHMAAEFAGGNPPSPASLPPRSCLEAAGSALITFDTAVTNQPGGGIGFCTTCSFNLTVGAQTFNPAPPFLQGFDVNHNPIGTDAFGLLLIGGLAPPFPLVLASVDPTLVPSTLPALVPIPDGLGNGVIGELDGAFSLLGFMSDVEILFTAFGTNVGDPIEGTLSGTSLEFTQAPLNPLPPLAAKACADGMDNDGDGSVDFPADPGCADADDDDEQSLALVCDDGVDNDGDGFMDFPGDPGCASSASTIEDPQCQDGLNNDGAIGTDFDGGISVLGFANADPNGPDPHCISYSDNLEAPSFATCGLGTELALLMPLLGWLRLRQRRNR